MLKIGDKPLNVDWDKLYVQKMDLIEAIAALQDKPRMTESLEGLLSLLDEIQDQAASQGIWEYPEDRGLLILLEDD